MTFRTVSMDRLEELAYESGEPIHVGAHEADCTVDGVMYVARLDGAA